MTTPPKKFELIAPTDRQAADRRLWQLRALRDFGDVKAGDLGGFVEYENNLSHDGECWIYDYASVSSGARVTEDAQVRDSAMVSGNAHLQGEVVVSGCALVWTGVWAGQATIHSRPPDPGPAAGRTPSP